MANNNWESVPPSILALAKAIDQELREELGTHYMGLLLAGSAMSQEPLPGSDVDLFALHAGAWRQRRVWDRGPYRIDLTLLAEAALSSAFSAWTTPGILDAFSHGTPISGEPGAVSRAKDRAIQVWRTGPPKLSPMQTIGLRSRLSALANHLAQGNDPFHVRHIAAITYAQCVDAFFDTRGHWRPGPKRALQRMRIVDKALADKGDAVLQAFGSDDSSEIIEAVGQFVDALLINSGGRLNEFSTARDPIMIPQSHMRPVASSASVGVGADIIRLRVPG